LIPSPWMGEGQGGGEGPKRRKRALIATSVLEPEQLLRVVVQHLVGY
jgi:hypothetical protein